MDAIISANTAQPEAGAYVRKVPAPDMRPPPATVGLLGWMRANLFSSVGSTIATVLIAALLAYIVPPLFDFLIVNAVWTGTDREACLPSETRPEVGACWAYIADRFAYIIYGSYPLPERWRVDVFFVLLTFGAGWLLWLDAPRRDLGAVFFFVILPIGIIRLAARLRTDGSCDRGHRAVGRHDGHDRGRCGGDRDVASARRHIGARATFHAPGGSAVVRPCLLKSCAAFR